MVGAGNGEGLRQLASVSARGEAGENCRLSAGAVLAISGKSCWAPERSGLGAVVTQAPWLIRVALLSHLVPSRLCGSSLGGVRSRQILCAVSGKVS